MRFFDLLNLQHVAIAIFPALVFVLIFGLALAYSHIRAEKGEKRARETYYVFPENIEDRQSPFPLALVLIIIGTVIWGIAYIVVSGLFWSKI